MPGLVSYISSTSFANEMAEMRQQVMEGQIGGFYIVFLFLNTILLKGVYGECAKTLFCYIKMTCLFSYNHFWRKGFTAEWM